MNIQLQQAYQDIWDKKNWQFNLDALKASIFRKSGEVSSDYNSHTFLLVFVPTNIKKHHEDWFLRDGEHKNGWNTHLD